jgi:hypothetical protein
MLLRTPSCPPFGYNLRRALAWLMALSRLFFMRSALNPAY